MSPAGLSKRWKTPLPEIGVRLFAGLPVALLLASLLAGCTQQDSLYRQESFVFGTRVEVSIHGEELSRAEVAAKGILQKFDALHTKLHAWQNSELNRLNSAFATGTAKLTADAELAQLLENARRLSLQSDGLFNPAIGNLVRLWGFHSDAPPGAVPGKADIDHWVSARPSMENVHIEHLMVWSDNPAVRLDLGGYAKGYALDQAVLVLRQHGVRNALVNIGGNVIALGKHGDRAWKVGIQHPRQAGVIATLELLDGEAIGTSGDYQRYFEADGKHYCHLIDPRTGWPASGMQSVTILVSGKDAGARSDALSKPLFIGEASQLAQKIDRLGLSQVLAIDDSGQILVSENLLKRLKWRDGGQTYHLLQHPALR
jgi:thiamine biosynthesis lipoprotein